jgi:hypothetical protein
MESIEQNFIRTDLDKRLIQSLLKQSLSEVENIVSSNKLNSEFFKSEEFKDAISKTLVSILSDKYIYRAKELINILKIDEKDITQVFKESIKNQLLNKNLYKVNEILQTFNLGKEILEDEEIKTIKEQITY